MYGLQPNDSSFFSDAVRNLITFDGRQDADVISSYAEVSFRIDNEREISLSRPIHGGDPKQISFHERASSHREREGKLLTGFGTMTDETGGFQRTLFDWLGLPIKPLMTVQGKPRQLYFENLGPLFYIEQLESWTDVQALQVLRYQLIDVREAAVEYLLGLDDRLASRFREQRSHAREQELKRAADSAVRAFNDFLSEHGLDKPLSSRGTLREFARFLTTFNVREYLKTNFNWDFTSERSHLSSELEGLRNELNEGTHSGTSGPALPESIATHVLDQKEALTKTEEELRGLRHQLSSQKSLIISLNDRIKSSKDLFRLKQTDVGIVLKAECPTCHRSIDPSDFNLVMQDGDAIESYIKTLERDREALLHSSAKAAVEIEALTGRLKRLEEAYFLEQRRLEAVNVAVGPTREALVDIASRIVSVERAIERNNRAQKQADEIQEEIDRTAKTIDKAVAETNDAASAIEDERLGEFIALFRQYLLDLGHGELNETRINDVHVSNEYVPYFRDRRLRSLGSASDRARLVLAYALAQLGVSHGHHPGFVFLDEPLQQNPDEEHRQAFRQFLSRDWQTLGGQVILITSLNKIDESYLQSQGVPFRVLPGDRLLSLKGSALRLA
jgi:DNA repair exonuclease SbcCD ATPase subunit